MHQSTYSALVAAYRLTVLVGACVNIIGFVALWAAATG